MAAAWGEQSGARVKLNSVDGGAATVGPQDNGVGGVKKLSVQDHAPRLSQPNLIKQPFWEGPWEGRTTMKRRLLALSLVALVLSSCTPTDDTSDSTTTTAASASATVDTPTTASAQWPRTIVHDAGETVIEEAPTRIVSTSPSLTGSILALDAPIIATAAAPVTGLTDDKGFFTKWAEEADEKNVEVLYADLEVDLDAIDTFEPDLILGSASAADDVTAEYDQLSDIAPTVLIDMAEPTWEDLLAQIGEATGTEDNVEPLVNNYNQLVAETADSISFPPQPVAAVVFLGPDGGWVAQKEEPVADLLMSLGFDYLATDAALVDQFIGTNAQVTLENLPAVLADAETVFLVPIGQGDPVADFTSSPVLANVPAVANGHVYSLGDESFKMDYYGAIATVERLAETL